MYSSIFIGCVCSYGTASRLREAIWDHKALHRDRLNDVLYHACPRVVCSNSIDTHPYYEQIELWNAIQEFCNRGHRTYVDGVGGVVDTFGRKDISAIKKVEQ